MYLAIGMSSEHLMCSGLEETWGKSSVKQRTRMWTAQPGEAGVVCVRGCVSVFEQLSYVENIPEGP